MERMGTSRSCPSLLVVAGPKRALVREEQAPRELSAAELVVAATRSMPDIRGALEILLKQLLAFGKPIDDVGALLQQTEFTDRSALRPIHAGKRELLCAGDIEPHGTVVHVALVLLRELRLVQVR